MPIAAMSRVPAGTFSLDALSRDTLSPGDRSVDLAVERLAAEFSEQLRPQLIVRVVRDCRRDLGGSPVGALPELVERLARIRLSESIV